MNTYYFYFNKASEIQHLHLIDTNTATLVGYYRTQEDIKLATFFSKDKFVVLTYNSGIYTGEVGNPELKKVVEEQGPATPGYYLDEKAGEFWIATTSKGDKKYILQCWNLFEGTLQNEIELPEYISLCTLTRRSDGCFVFYNNEFDSLSSEDNEHGFYCTNTNTKETKYHKLDSKAVTSFSFNDRNALFVHNKDIAVLPASDEYICTKNDEGKSSYEYQVQVIDLKDFTIRWKKCLNKFTAKDICDYDEEEEKQEELDGLAKNWEDSDFDDVVEDWSEFLYILTLSNDEEAFWLRWGDGSISKVDFDGNLLTPVYHLEENKENKAEITRIEKDEEATKERIIMYEADLVHVDLTQTPYINDGKNILYADKVKGQQLKISKEYQSMVKKYGINLIQVSEFNKEGTHEAVCKLAQKMQDIESLIINDKLVFEFIDNYGQYESEHDVIGSAVYYKENIPYIKEAINSFHKYSDSKNLLNGKGDPAFSDTIMWLCEVPNGFDVLSLYFNAIDPQKAEYFITKVLPAVREHYSHLDGYKAFEKSLPKEFSKKKKLLGWFK